MPVKPATPRQLFGLFKAEVLAWQQKFGLVSWHLEIVMRPLDSAAHIVYDAANGRAAISLNSDCAGYTTADVKRYAFHEVCHLLLARFCETAETRWATQDALEKEEHVIIRTLETVLLGK